jgi:hypothetical protein
LAGHLHKGEAPGAAGIAIGDDLDVPHLVTPFFKEGAELLRIYVKGEIADVHLRSHDSVSLA